MKTYELNIAHCPSAIKENTKYSKKVFDIMGWDCLLKRYFRKIEVCIKKLWKRLFCR